MRWETANIGKTLERIGIEAKRKGREWYGLCPNPGHQDQKPSWRMRDEPGTERHGRHHCWPCGFKGSLVTLIMEKMSTDFAGAAAWVEGEGLEGADIPVPEIVKVITRRLHPKFTLPAGVLFKPYEKWVSTARKYVEARGITREQIERWGIGYAVDGKLGGRIVFPYRDANNEVQGYTARTFVGDELRYREPDPSEKAKLGAMFGEQHWPSRLLRVGKPVYVVEGAINALALERAVPGALVAATAGSSANMIHALKLASFSHMVLLTDPDPAGDKLAEDIAGLVTRHATLVRVRLPEKRDAADLTAEELQSWLSRPLWVK